MAYTFLTAPILTGIRINYNINILNRTIIELEYLQLNLYWMQTRRNKEVRVILHSDMNSYYVQMG